MSGRLAFLSQRVLNTPLMMHPTKANVIVAALAERLGVARIDRFADLDGFEPAQQVNDRPYDAIAGIAVIDVAGTLVNKLGSLRPMSGLTGYDGIRACFLDALADETIAGICLSVDSGGGECAGCFDLVDLIYEARGVKPIHAILNENAFSAAYAIASAADVISVPRIGGTGSIGVISMHCDISGALNKAGLVVTILQHGARKADGSEVVPLSDAARDGFQGQIDEIGEIFVQTVARNRGIPAASVEAMQAGIFQGQAGVTAGLADFVEPPDAAFRRLLAATAA